MPRFSGATWLPITHNVGPRRAQTIGFVLHVQVGNGSLRGYFDNPATGASSHFWAAKDGRLEQYVDTDLTAWTQGAGNASYVSVECEGYPSEAMTSAQLVNVATLLDWLAGLYSFLAVGPVAHGMHGFTPHCNPDGTPDVAWGNHSCPEALRLAQMPSIVAMAQPGPGPEQGEDDMDAVVLSDGTIVSHFRTPNDHYIEVTRKAGTQGTAMNPTNTSVVDLTAQWPGFEAAG